MSPGDVALGLADALLAGPAERWSAQARCAKALDEAPAWLFAMCWQMIVLFASRWQADSRYALAVAICEWPGFLQAWTPEHQPYLRYYFLESPRIGARPLALERCALPDIPTVGAIADWLRLDVRDVDWLADCRGREASVADQRLRHYRYRWVRKRSVGHRLLEMPKTAWRAVQRRILRELLEYVPAHEAAHGFGARHSCLTHARQHVGQQIVIRMDLKDFFLSISAHSISTCACMHWRRAWARAIRVTPTTSPSPAARGSRATQRLIPTVGAIALEEGLAIIITRRR